MLVGDLDPDRVNTGVRSAAAREDVAAVGLEVSGRRQRVWHGDRRSAKIAGRRAGPVVNVLERTDLATVLVGPIDQNLLDPDRPRGRDDVAFDPLKHQAVRAGEASAFGGEHRAVAARELHRVPRVPDERELDHAEDEKEQQRKHKRELHERLPELLPASEKH